MENCQENDFVCFGNDCEAIHLAALAESSMFIESLGLNNLQRKMRAGRIYLEIGIVIKDIDALNRPFYMMYCKDIPYLFKVFKATNRLKCLQEMEKLKKAMIFKYKFDCLARLQMDIDINERVERYFVTNEIDLGSDRLQADKGSWTMPVHHDFLSKGFLPADIESEKTLVSKCTVSEETLFFIIVLLNQRLNFLKHKSSIGHLIHWIMFPNMDQPGVKIKVGCKTNELRYIMDQFKSLNNDIKNVSIECYGHFISRFGKDIKAGCIRSSICDNLNTRLAIENIFALALEKKD